MAATFAFRASQSGRFHPDVVPGAFDEAIIDVSGDASYPAGGYAFGVAQLQNISGGAFSTIESVEVVNNWVSSTPSSFFAVWNAATGKIMAHATPTPSGAAVAAVDVTAGTNLSTFKCSIKVRFN